MHNRLKRKKNIGGQVALHIIFILICICYIVPLMLTVSAAFTSEKALSQGGFSILPKEFSLDAFKLVFKSPEQILNSYKTTITFSAISTFLAVLVMGIMAYPLSRPNFVFRKVITFIVFFTMLFSAGLVPSYMVNTQILHLKNTIWIYILPGLVSAWNLIVIRTSYKGLPYELIESAKLDGASEWTICFKIVMPLCKATLATIGFLFLVGKWNDWVTSSIYIRNPDLYSLQYLLQKILREAQILKQMAAADPTFSTAGLMPTESLRYAMAVVAGGPMLVVFPFFQKYFAKGMTIGAVKG